MAAIASASSTGSCAEPIVDNPLLAAYAAGPEAIPDLSRVRPEHIMPAYEAALARRERLLDEIRAETAPTFENVIRKLDVAEADDGFAGEALGWFISGNTSPEWEHVEATLYTPLATDWSTRTFADRSLFEKVEAVYRKRQELPEDAARLTEDYYKAFVNNGVALDDAKRERFRAIALELAQLSSQFRRNVTESRKKFQWHILDPKELAGVPEETMRSLAAAAEAQGLKGYLVTLDPKTQSDLLEYCDVPETRRRVLEATYAIANGGDEHDNNDLANRIAALRMERAALLGYATFADFVLADRMVRSRDNLDRFYRELEAAYLPHARREEAEFVAFFQARTGSTEKPMPWDRPYYARLMEEELHSIDRALLRNYFELDNVRRVLFVVIHRLFGLTLAPTTEIPAPGPDIFVYRVTERDGSLIGYVYFDPFARIGRKRPGAWMNGLRDTIVEGGGRRPSLVAVTMNLRKGAGDEPTLLDVDDVETLFHEFGHALHHLLGQSRFHGQFGTSVAWDFVELPSQFLENFVWIPEVLGALAVHWQTGEKLPEEEARAIVAAKNFRVASGTVGQIALGMLDMAWATGQAPVEGESPLEFEERILAHLDVTGMPRTRPLTPAFTHVFAGGYASGYYSYLWSRVLDADAFSVFEANGFWSPDVAERFRREVLAVGDSRDPAEAYRRFAGRDPSIGAMLRRDGLPEKKDEILTTD
jgi:peptidyl-dipeptidase Dcp